MTRSIYEVPFVSRAEALGVAFLAGLLISGCGARELIPSPNLYVLSDENPYEDTPESLRTNEVDVLYVTDRMPVEEEGGALGYDHRRSRSMAFGSAAVRFGDEDTAWEDLVAASRTHDREGDYPVEVVRVEEKHRFPPTPFPFVQAPDGQSVAGLAPRGTLRSDPDLAGRPPARSRAREAAGASRGQHVLGDR